MKKLISIVMFTLFAAAAGASLANVPAHEPRTTASTTTNAFDPVCSPAYVACTDDCQDLSAGAKAACLRICRLEYQECLEH
jgi:hypothetical protein